MDLNELVVKIIGDASELQKALQSGSADLVKFGNAAQQTQQKSETMFSSFVKAQVAFELLKKGFQIITGALKDWMRAAIEDEQRDAKLDAAIKSIGKSAAMTATQVKELAASLANESTFSRDVIQDSETLLLRFTAIGKEVFPRAQKAILDVASALGRDLTSVASVVGRALENPIAAMGRLRAVNVILTEDQKALIKQLQESGDLFGAQKIILDQLEKSYGGTAEAMRNTLGGAVQVLKNDFEEMGKSIVSGLLPTLKAIVQFVDNIVKWFTALDGSTKGLILGLTAFAIGVVVVVANLKKLNEIFTVLKANPWILAIGLIIAGIAALNEVLTKNNNRFKEGAEAQEKERDETHKLIKEYNDLKSKTSLNAEEKVKLTQIEGILKARIGETSEFIDKQTGLINENSKAVQNYNTQSITTQIQLLKSHEEELNKHIAWLNDDREAQEHMMKVYGESTPGYAASMALRDKDTQSLKENGLEWSNLELKIAALTDILNGTESATKDATDAADDLTGAIGSLTSAFQKLNPEAGTTASKIASKFIEGFDKIKAAAKETGITFAKVFSDIGNAVNTILGSITTAINNYFDNLQAQQAAATQAALDALDAQTDAQLKVYNADTGAHKRELQEKLHADQALLAQERDANKRKELQAVVDADQRELAILTIQENAAKERDRIERETRHNQAQYVYEAAKAAWAIQLTQAIVGTALAVVNALALPPPWNIIESIAAGIAGGVEIGVIAANPPQPPAFAAGVQNFGGGLALVGEQGPEYVQLPRGSNVYNNQQTQNMQSGGAVTVNITAPPTATAGEIDRHVRRTLRDLAWQGRI